MTLPEAVGVAFVAKKQCFDTVFFYKFYLDRGLSQRAGGIGQGIGDDGADARDFEQV